jgi:hypothetical protein
VVRVQTTLALDTYKHSCMHPALSMHTLVCSSKSSWWEREWCGWVDGGLLRVLAMHVVWTHHEPLGGSEAVLVCFWCHPCG